MKSRRFPVILFLAALLFPIPFPIETGAQETEGPETGETSAGETGEQEIPDDFLDPFAIEEDPLEEGPGPGTDDTDTDAENEENEEDAETGESADGDAETDGPEEDFEALFEEDMIEEVDTETQDTAPEEDFLVQETVRWGGSFTGSITADWTWNTVGSADFSLLDPSDRLLTPLVATDLFFDVRPKKDFRVFGKFKIDIANDGDGGITGLEGFGVGGVDDTSLPEGWTSTVNEQGDTEIRNEDGVLLFTIPAEDAEDEEDEEEPAVGTVPTLSLEVFELFSDFSVRERLFFRFGKHTIRWGVGYFWSPADVLNLTAIDVEDPTADREGPVSLKTQFPFGPHNAYLYLITNLGAKPIEVAVAPKVEFVLGTWEIGFGGYYQNALAPRIVTMATTSWRDFDFFGEIVASWGSDRVFVRESRNQEAALEDPEDDLETVLDTYEVEDRPFFHLTAGFRYLRSFTEERGSIACMVQYWLNGEGYPSSRLLEPSAYLALNPNTNGLLIEDEEDQPEGYEAPPALGLEDLADFGMHYGGVFVNWEIFKTGFNLSFLVIANLTDFSGFLLPALSYEIFDYFSVSLSTRFTFGGPGDEYSNPSALFPGNEHTGTLFTLSFSMSVGSGQF
jgi:hypothetical protein